MSAPVANPFMSSGMVPPEKFVGRDHELKEIEERLSTDHHVSLVGRSQIGKSSLLNFITRRGDSQRRYVYLDMQRIDDEPSFWRQAIQALGGSGESPRDLLELSKQQPVVLAIDEMEKAGSMETFDSGFWQSLRSYAQEPTLSLLVATSQPLSKIEPEHETSPLANLFSLVQLPELSDEECRRLIADYLEPTGVTFSAEEIVELLTSSKGQPAELQAKCFNLFKRKQAGGDEGESPPAFDSGTSQDQDSVGEQKGRYEASAAFTSDTPQKEDWIWGDIYAQALADFIAHEDTHPPLVIGINAPWGGGKSSLMEAVRSRLDPDHDDRPEGENLSLGGIHRELASGEDSNHSKDPKLKLKGTKSPTVWFNAWKYSKDEQLWAALVQNILRQLTERMDPVQRERFFLRLNLRRLDRDKIRFDVYQSLLTRAVPGLLFVLGLVVATICGFALGLFGMGWTKFVDLFKGPLTWPEVLSGVAVLVDVGAVVAVFWKVWSTKKKPVPFKLADYVKRPLYSKKVGFLGEVEEDLQRLQELIAGQRLVIFVDDLDRCSPRKVVELIEAINVFFGMDSGHWIFVLGIDADFVEASIESSYEKLVATMTTRKGEGTRLQFGRHFLEKMVQVWLTLPEPEIRQLESYLRSVIRGGRVEEKPSSEKVEKAAEEIRGEAKDLASVDAVVRERGKDLDDEDKMALDEAARKVAVEYFTESDPEVQSILEEALAYLGRNPRQVKRFLNLFRLAALVDFRTRKLTERGLPAEYFRRLAKWVALSMRYPRLARKAQADPTVLEALEKAAAEESTWERLAAEEEWTGLLESGQRELLKAGVQLGGSSIDFTVLV